MASVVEDLKGKMAELDARLAAIRAEAATLEVQKAAFNTVIAVYDPASVTAAASRRPANDRSPPARRVTDLLKGRDVRHGILETLRDSEAPILASEVSQRYLAREGLEGSADGLWPRLSGRFSGMLDKLEKDRLVRAIDAPDGRRRLWEIAR